MYNINNIFILILNFKYICMHAGCLHNFTKVTIINVKSLGESRLTILYMSESSVK